MSIELVQKWIACREANDEDGGNGAVALCTDDVYYGGYSPMGTAKGLAEVKSKWLWRMHGPGGDVPKTIEKELQEDDGKVFREATWTSITHSHGEATHVSMPLRQEWTITDGKISAIHMTKL